jgi:hypothetical protein
MEGLKLAHLTILLDPLTFYDIAKEMMSGINKTSAIAYIASKDNSYKVSTLTKDFNI